MAEITVSEGQVTTYQGDEETLVMRIYCDQTFTASGGEAVVRGAVGSNDWFKEVACTVDADGIVTHEPFTIESTEDGTPDSSHYAFALYTNAGEQVGSAVYRDIAVPATPTTTTLGVLAGYSNTCPASVLDRFYTAISASAITTLITNLVAALTKATTVIYGIGKLNHAAVSADDPIFVGDNHPQWRAGRETVYLEAHGHSQAGCAAAIAAIGSTPTRLRVTDPVAITANTTFHANTIVEIEGNGAFSGASGSHTLTLTLDPATDDSKAIFSGSMNVVVRGSRLKFGWFATAGATDHTWAWTQARASLAAAGGADLLFNKGDWYINEADIPSNCALWGSGVGNIDGVGGTVLRPQSLTATHVVGVSGAHRNVQLHNLTIDRKTSTTARSFWVRGTGPDSGFSIYCTGTTFRSGTSASTVPIVEFDSLGSAWETMPNTFVNCAIYPIGAQLGFKCDTPNTNFTWISPQFWAGAGGTCLELASVGWFKAINSDWRRIGGSYTADTYALNRNVTGSITNGTNTITLTSGSFVENDIGQLMIRLGSVDGRIIELVSATEAKLSANATATITAQTVAINYYEPNTSLAYACIKSTGSFNAIDIDNGADEGFQWFLHVANDTLFGAISVRRANIGSRFYLGGARTVIVEDCNIGSQAFDDASGKTSHIFTRNMVSNTSSIAAYGGNSCNLTRPRNWGVHAGSSVIHDEQDIWTGAPAFAHGPRAWDRRGHPMHIILPTGSEVAAFGLGSQDEDVLTQMRIGRFNPYTEGLDYYYDQGRQGGNVAHGAGSGPGRWRHHGNQEERYRGFDINSDVRMSTMNLAEESITVSSTPVDLQSLTRAHTLRMTCTGTKVIRSLTSMAYDGGFRHGEHKRLVNVGAGIFVLNHEDPAADPPIEDPTDGLGAEVFRFLSPTGKDVYLYPGDSVWVYRDDTSERWRIIPHWMPMWAYLDTTVTYNAVTALANTALAINVPAGRVHLKAWLTGDSAVKALNVDFGGTAVFSSFLGSWSGRRITSLANALQARVTAMGTDFTNAGIDGISYVYEFEGSGIVSAAGTLIVRGAQNVSDASNTTILAGSFLRGEMMN